MRNKPYKNVYIVRAKSGDWRITYEYENPDAPGEFKKFYVRDGINYVHDLEEKEKEAQTLKEDLIHYLDNGFNPFLADPKMDNAIFASEVEVKVLSDIRLWSIKDGFKKYIEACKKKNLSKNTIRTYQTFINNFETWCTAYDMLDRKLSEMSTNDVLQFLDESFDAEEWTPRTYNNHITFLKTFFTKIAKLERKSNKEVEYQVDLEDLEKKMDRAEKNRYYTAVIVRKVKERTRSIPQLNNYIKWIFYSCMRPREIKLLKIQHIDLEGRQIKAIAPTAKTGDRFVPICDELFSLIRTMKLESKHPNDYVFGKNGITGPEPIYKDHFSNIYKSIKDELGLDDKYTLYGFKHTRVVNLLSSGFTDNEVMTLTGHKDYKSFLAYKRDLVLDNTVMKGKTIYF